MQHLTLILKIELKRAEYTVVLLTYSGVTSAAIYRM